MNCPHCGIQLLDEYISLGIKSNLSLERLDKYSALANIIFKKKGHIYSTQEKDLIKKFIEIGKLTRCCDICDTPCYSVDESTTCIDCDGKCNLERPDCFPSLVEERIYKYFIKGNYTKRWICPTHGIVLCDKKSKFSLEK